MLNVFISYSTRGATSFEWIDNFCTDLKKYYQINYSKELNLWYGKAENRAGDDYRKKIDEALKDSLMFLPVLDPGYLDSPEALYEYDEYTRLRDAAGELKHYFKVIKWQGNREAEMKEFIDNHLVITYFSKFNSDENEEEFQRGNKEYINQVQNIVKAIHKRQIKQSRKLNCEKLLAALESTPQIPKLYVALGYSGSKDSRSIFINELSKTINREHNLKNVKVIPDDFTLSGLSYQDLEDLFYQENEYGEKCLRAMMDKSLATIIHLDCEKIPQAEEILRKLQFQISLIKEEVQRKKLINIFANVPEQIYETSTFLRELQSPAYSSYDNIKLDKGIDITTFISSYITQLETIIGTKQEVAAAPAQKHIYIIEYYCPDKDLVNSPEMEKLKLEKENKQKLRRYIVSKQFIIVPSLRNNANLKDAIEHHIRFLNISEGIIIYRGIRDDYSWCIQQQTDTYNIILNLNAEKKKNINRAVYVDPMQDMRDREDYFFYNYDVILEYPELDNFLCKIRPH